MDDSARRRRRDLDVGLDLPGVAAVHAAPDGDGQPQRLVLDHDALEELKVAEPPFTADLATRLRGSAISSLATASVQPPACPSSR